MCEVGIYKRKTQFWDIYQFSLTTAVSAFVCYYHFR